MIVFSTFDAGANGCPLKTATSPSLPTSIEPTRLSMPSCMAGLSVIIFSASFSVVLPYCIADAPLPDTGGARVRRESELIDTTTPRSRHERHVVRNRVPRFDLVRPHVGERRCAGAVLRDLVGDLVALEHVLEGLDA